MRSLIISFILITTKERRSRGVGSDSLGDGWRCDDGEMDEIQDNHHHHWTYKFERSQSTICNKMSVGDDLTGLD